MSEFDKDLDIIIEYFTLTKNYPLNFDLALSKTMLLLVTCIKEKDLKPYLEKLDKAKKINQKIIEEVMQSKKEELIPAAAQKSKEMQILIDSIKTREQYQSWTIKMLKPELKRLKLNPDGRKAELINRIINHKENLERN